MFEVRLLKQWGLTQNYEVVARGTVGGNAAPAFIRSLVLPGYHAECDDGSHRWHWKGRVRAGHFQVDKVRVYS